MKVIILLSQIVWLGLACNNPAHHPARKFYSPTPQTGFEFQVAVILVNQFRCSGSIISPKSILTTAACIDGLQLDYVYIYAGRHSLRDMGVQAPIPAKELIPYDEYEENIYTNNIGIIKTKDNLLGGNTNIRSIPMNFYGLNNEDVRVNISGWGAKLVYKALQIRYVTVSVINWFDCVPKLRVRPAEYTEAFCTIGNATEQFCWEEEGGPVVLDNELIGITITSPVCLGANIHIAIGTHMDWINSVISGD